MKTSLFLRRSFWLSLLFLTVVATGLPLKSRGESVTQLKAHEDLTREYMVEISRHLGVTCTQCHNIDNFTDTIKSSYKISLEHMKLVQVLKANGMDGKNKKPEANCYMCHRGKLKPDYLEPEKK